ncbi:hypothetical protein [Pelosinus sp. sgz500959]|uniref:hypothetical protein n=1 Tax=Pelosinus sp. sgz500959 TaxID=3242472 RepID=UPI00366DBD54
MFLPNLELNNEQISDGVNLLISILVRYPEIGTIKFDPQKKCLNFKFMLSTIPPEFEFSTIKNLLTSSISAYNMLEGFPLKISEIQLDTYSEVAMLTIIRDVYTLSKSELTLMITLLRENFKKYLIIDGSDSPFEEDLLMQEEVIEDMLANIKAHHHLHALIGIRENGRVLVFNK